MPAPPPPPPQKPEQKSHGSTRPLMSEAPLTIENLPTRIQKGECTVLPPKFCPPSTCFSMPPCTPCFPQPACCPGPPCGPPCYIPTCPPTACFPPCPPTAGTVCYPSCPPTAGPLCYPPPVVVCPPAFTSPYPCLPPPNCCPPPPCPPPPCQPCTPKCCPPTDCCSSGGSGGGCCRSPKQIICLPKGTSPIVRECRVNATASIRQRQNAKRTNLPVAKCCNNDAQGPGGGGGSQPPSYNNCNFYLTEIPKELKGMLGLGGASRGDDYGGADTDGNNTDDTDDDCCNCDDECDDEQANTAAGDDRYFNPPLGYPGSQRQPWGCGFPGLGPCAPYPFGATMNGLFSMGLAAGMGQGIQAANGFGRNMACAMGQRTCCNKKCCNKDDDSGKEQQKALPSASKEKKKKKGGKIPRLNGYRDYWYEDEELTNKSDVNVSGNSRGGSAKTKKKK